MTRTSTKAFLDARGQCFQTMGASRFVDFAIVFCRIFKAPFPLLFTERSVFNVAQYFTEIVHKSGQNISAGFPLLLLVLFSACGGMRTGRNMPVMTPYFLALAYGILGKGGLFLAPPIEDCRTGLTGSSTRNRLYQFTA